MSRDFTITPGFDKLDLLLAFSDVDPEVADAWVDTRLIGRLGEEIAAEEGVTRAAISHRVKRAERAIVRYVRARQP